METAKGIERPEESCVDRSLVYAVIVKEKTNVKNGLSGHMEIACSMVSFLFCRLSLSNTEERLYFVECICSRSRFFLMR